jgi:DNA-binding winged helix-turn-helix (wHTH) protein
VHQQDNLIQINQWVFSFAQSTLTKANSDQFIDDSLESVELSHLTRDILWKMISSFPIVVSADELLTAINDESVNRNKLYQTIAKLRRIFDDKTHDAFYIETVPRKGYRWLAEPLQRDSLSIEQVSHNGSGSNTSTEKYNEVYSGVLDQNIFDDLGFISHVDQQDRIIPEQQVKKNIIPTIESLPLPSNNKGNQKKPVNTDKKTWAWGKIITAVVLFIVLLVMAYRMLVSPKDTVFIPTDVLYVSSLKLADTDGGISSETLERIQWWVDQKLQHLPAVKVMPYMDNGDTPRLSGVVESVESGFKINILITPKLKEAKRNEIDLLLSNSLSQNLFQNNAFNQLITSLITGTDAITLVNDKCDVSSFTAPQSLTPQCLVTIDQRYQQLLHKLATQTLSDTDEIVASQMLETLARETITLYSNQSLGYVMLARYFNMVGLFEREHEQLLLAMALNQNSASILSALSESYRRRSEFNHSLVLIDALLDRGVLTQYAVYWKAYDLVALGFLEKAQQLIQENNIELTTLEQETYFFGVNYNRLKDYLNQTEHQTPKVLNYIDELISDNAYCIEQHAIDICLREATSKLNSDYAIKQWQAAALHLKGGNAQQGYQLLSDEPWLEELTISLVDGADRLFYLPTYANILIQTGQKKEAKALLKRFIVFLKSSGQHQLYALPLAEAYALSGQSDDALNQMAQLLASGWLPAAKYQEWPLKDNPNFDTINRQWQFLNLLELIENRRQLIRLRVEDLRKTQ